MLENRPSILGSCEDIFSFATLHPGSAVVSETGRKWRRSQSGVEWKDRAGVQASKPPAGPLWVPSGDRGVLHSVGGAAGLPSVSFHPRHVSHRPSGSASITVERGGGSISTVSSKKTLTSHQLCKYNIMEWRQATSVELVPGETHKYLASHHTLFCSPRCMSPTSDSLSPAYPQGPAEPFMGAVSPSLLAWPSL